MSFIKDFVVAITSIVTAVIAILAYISARRSLLQPMKSSVVEKQTDLLMNLVLYLKNDFEEDEVASCFETIELTVYDYFLSIGYVFRNQDEVKKVLNTHIRFNSI